MHNPIDVLLQTAPFLEMFNAVLVLMFESLLVGIVLGMAVDSDGDVMLSDEYD